MLKRNLIANYLGQGWAVLVGIIFVPLYIKYLGMEAYGLVGLFTLLSNWMILLDAGMTPTMNREMARFTAGHHTATSIRDLLRSIEIISLSIATFIVISIALASNWLATSWLKTERLPINEVSQAFIIIGFVVATRFIESIYRSCLFGLQKQVLFNLVNIIIVTIRSVGAVAVLAWISPTIQIFFIWQGLVSIVTVITIASLVYQNLPKASRRGQFSLEALRNISKFAGGILVVMLLALLLTQVDKILLSKLLTLSEYGRYTLASVVAGGMHTVATPIIQAWYPRLTQLYASNKPMELAHTFHQGAQLISVTVGSIALVLITHTETLLLFWTQNAELAHATAPLLRLLVLGNLLHSLAWIPYQTQLAHGWTSLALWVNVVAVSILMPAIIIIVPRHGAMGAAWVWIVLTASYAKSE